MCYQNNRVNIQIDVRISVCVLIVTINVGDATDDDDAKNRIITF